MKTITRDFWLPIIYILSVGLLLILLLRCSPSKEASEYYEEIMDTVELQNEIDSLYNNYFGYGYSYGDTDERKIEGSIFDDEDKIGYSFGYSYTENYFESQEDVYTEIQEDGFVSGFYLDEDTMFYLQDTMFYLHQTDSGVVIDSAVVVDILWDSTVAIDDDEKRINWTVIVVVAILLFIGILTFIFRKK
jgi:hypothetical protein